MPARALGWLRLGRLATRRAVKRRGRVNLSASVKLRLYGTSHQHTFFGYYDLCPFNQGQARLLAHVAPFGTSAGSSVRIGHFGVDHLGDNGFVSLGETAAWCWQQGSRLQWMPGQDDLVFANDIQNGVQRGLIRDSNSGQIVQETARPVYDIAADGKRGISLNFSRLQRLRPGYGYQPDADPSFGQPAPADDGLWIVDMETGRDRLVFSLADAARFAPHKSMAEAEHYFNHVKWNPTGRRFLVFHLWRDDQGRRHSRALTLDVDGDVRAVINSRHVSHYWWLDDDRLLFYGTPVGKPEGYYLHRDAHEMPPLEWWGNFLPNEDGHPSVSRDGRWLVTDTLPDIVSERRLLIGEPAAKSLRQVASFYSPPALSGEIRCDLHPRWSPTGNMIAVDTAHAGYRQIGILNLSISSR